MFVQGMAVGFMYLAAVMHIPLNQVSLLPMMIIHSYGEEKLWMMSKLK